MPAMPAMHRSTLVLAALFAASAAAAQPLDATFTREQVTGDVAHYAFTVPVGDTPNAVLHIHRVVRERAPYFPQPSRSAILMNHGDFASFASNFAPVLANPSGDPGIAVWLAERGVDVWGLDRRWTNPPRGGDTSDFDAMGLDQELDDIGTALGFARGVRLATDGSFARLTLVGFSRGGQLGYYYAAREATRPAWQRHLRGLVPLDVFASVDPTDEDVRQFFCTSAFYEYQDLGAGIVDSPNGFQIKVGQLDESAPDVQSPFQVPPFVGFTNHQVVLGFAGQTYNFFPPSPWYHLAAPILDGDAVVGLRESDEDDVAGWFAASPFHQSLREAADTDALVCNEPPLPADVPLSRIRVPLFLIAAAGGYGTHALYSTTQVSSTDVTTLLIRRLPAGREAEDFGHGDLLFARDAATLAWAPLLAWLRQHE